MSDLELKPNKKKVAVAAILGTAIPLSAWGTFIAGAANFLWHLVKGYPLFDYILLLWGVGVFVLSIVGLFIHIMSQDYSDL